MAFVKTKYQHIRAWGQMMGSAQYYVTDQIAKATEDNAPQDAIYLGQDGKWVTFANVTSVDTRHTIENILDGWRRR